MSILSVNINKSDVEATVENGAIRLGLNMVKGLGSAEAEKIVADIAATGVGSDNPVALLRRQLELRGVIPASKLMDCENARRIFLAGVVTHRQRPQTAAGGHILGLEDETSLANAVVSVGLWKRNRAVKVARAVLVRGVVHHADGAASVTADRVEELPFAEMMSAGSRDFR